MSEITYRFVATGQETVLRAFASVEQAARRNADAVRRYYTEETRAADRAGRAVAKAEREKASEATRQAREKERALQAQQKAAEKAAREEKRIAERAVAEKAKATQREVKDRQRAHDYVAKIRDRHFAGEQKARERTEAARAKLEQRASRERERAIAREVKLRERATALDARREDAHQQRMARMRFAQEQAAQRHHGKLTQIEEGAKRRSTRIQEDAASKEAKLREQFANKGKVNKYDRANSLLRGAGRLAFGVGAAVTSAAVGTGAAALGEGVDLQRIANRISINARKSGEGFIDPTELRRQFEAASIATNGAVSAQEVAEGTQKFISKTGDISGARKFMSVFATTAAASGSSFEDIASASAELTKKFGISTPEEMGAALASVTFGGKEGAFEISDAAQKYAKLASAGSTFGLDKGVGGVRVLQGLSQIAMDSTGDRDVATTGVEAMFRQIITESGNIKKKLGVDVFTDASKTKARDITKLLPEIIAASGGDMTVLQDIFKDEGKRGVNPLIDTFNRAYQGATGKGGKAATDKERIAAGRAAVDAQLQKSINAPGTYADLQMDASRATQGDPSAKLAATWERITAAISDRTLPAVTQLLERFEASDEAINNFADAFEGLIDVISTSLKLLGIVKDPSDAEKKRREQKKIKDIDTQLSALPSLEKVAALGAQGKTAEAQAMLAEFKNPETRAKIAQLEAQRAVAAGNIAGIDKSDADRSARQKIATQADAVTEYLKLGGKPATAADEQAAREIMASIANRGKSSSYASADAYLGRGREETDLQKQFRTDFAQTIAEKRASSGASQEGEAVNEKAATGLAAMLDRIKRSADGAAKSLEKLESTNRADVVKG